MHQIFRLHELLYVSSLAPDAPFSVVADITRAARIANRHLGITGLLVFDGERFAQHLEGSMKSVVQLFERICNDARHTDVKLLHQGPIAQRKFKAFAMGFANVDEADVLATLEKLSGQNAANAFLLLSTHADLPP